jgi:cobyrinic acid a,c-diamide synthase
MHQKPVGRGYVILAPTPDHPWARRPASADFSPIHAHEFHYSEIRGLPTGTRFAYQVERGHGIDGQHDGIVMHNLLASYTHLRGTAGCDWPARFVQFAQQCQTMPREIAPCST